MVKHQPPVYNDLDRCQYGPPRFLGNIELETLVKIVSLSPQDYEGFKLMSLQILCSKYKSLEKFYYILPTIAQMTVCVAKW